MQRSGSLGLSPIGSVVDVTLESLNTSCQWRSSVAGGVDSCCSVLQVLNELTCSDFAGCSKLYVLHFLCVHHVLVLRSATRLFLEISVKSLRPCRFISHNVRLSTGESRCGGGRRSGRRLLTRCHERKPLQASDGTDLNVQQV